MPLDPRVCRPEGDSGLLLGWPPASPVRLILRKLPPLGSEHSCWQLQAVSRRRHFFSSNFSKSLDRVTCLSLSQPCSQGCGHSDRLDVELVPWTSRGPPLAGNLWAQKWASSEKNPGMMVGRRDSGLANTKYVHLGFSQNPLT